MKFVGAVLLIGFMATLWSCGSSTRPPNALDARSAIRAAEAVGARRDPPASLHLKFANDQLRTAEALLRAGNPDDARLVLQRAEADAELSAVLARKAKARARARQAHEEIDRLRRRARQ